MDKIYYHTSFNKLKLIKFYKDNIVITASLTDTTDINKNNFLKTFDKDNMVFQLFLNKIFFKNIYEIDILTKDYIFEYNSFTHRVVFLNENELIIEIKNNFNNYIFKNRYSSISNFPNKNDEYEYTQSFYPIILIPSRIICNSKLFITNDEALDFLKIKIPTLEKWNIPTKPKNYKLIEKEKYVIIEHGCLVFSLIPIIFIIFLNISTNEINYLAFFLSFIPVTITLLISKKKKIVTEKISLNEDELNEENQKYEIEKNIIINKNIKIDKENEKNKKIIESLNLEKIEFAKKQIFLKNVKPNTKSLRSNQTIKKGRTELFFLEKLYNKFGKQIKVEMILNDEFNTYTPDFTLVCENTGLHIDIEIDEPYTFQDKKPIHHIESKDYLRNKYFLEQNWCIIRFSENQIINQTNKCILLIEDVIQSIIKNDFIFPIDKTLKENTWTYEEALIMIFNNSRNNFTTFNTGRQ